jgi:hypothetical protein
MPSSHGGPAMTRRRAIGSTLKALLGLSVLPHTRRASGAETPAVPLRAVNVMNFIRASEPRNPADLVTPVREQMALVKRHGLPATWLLQYDALFEGPFVELLKKEMPPTHEVGLWHEMNRPLVDAAGVRWRGREDWSWDYHVPSAYTIGYTPEERRKLAEVAIAGFERVWGRKPRTVGSWLLDAGTMAQMSDDHGVEIFGLCREQVSTDGFTVWGGPIGGYYPSRTNAFSPALSRAHQIDTPVVRLLGQDPVYYYEREGSGARPDTMEPVWPSGQDPTFVRHFLEMIGDAPVLQFSYAQLGQENSFQWPAMKDAYPMQMAALARARDEERIAVETMGETGRRFRETFATTPAQAQVMLADPFDRTGPGERTVWYQSRYYRANLHFRGRHVSLRDIVVYSDRFPEPFLETPTTEHGIELRLPPVLDGYHWSDDAVQTGGPGAVGRRAQGYFVRVAPDGARTRLDVEGPPEVRDRGTSLEVELKTTGSGTLRLVFDERGISAKSAGGPSGAKLALAFEWRPKRSALTGVASNRLEYRFRDLGYAVDVVLGRASATATGAEIEGEGSAGVELQLAQPA